MTRALSDYEKYIRTDELLALQKPFEALACHDELQFQTIHQVAELWMKLAGHELLGARAAWREDRVALALRYLGRVRQLLDLMHQQMVLLDTMTPHDYMTIRDALGRGSGQESPGFKNLMWVPGHIWPDLEALLARRGVTLGAVYGEPEAHEELFQLCEALIDVDQRLQAWRYRHLLLVYRQIGTGTPSLKGKASDLLVEGMKHRFFPALWDVRDQLFDAWTRSHPHGADRGYHG